MNHILGMFWKEELRKKLSGLNVLTRARLSGGGKSGARNSALEKIDGDKNTIMGLPIKRIKKYLEKN